MRPDALQVVHERDAEALELPGRPDAGALQDRRAPDRARGEHDDVRVDSLARREDDRAGTAVDQLDAVDGDARPDLEVGAPAGRREIRDRRALPYAIDLVDGQRPRSHGTRRVEVLDDLVTGLRATVQERAHDRAQALAGEAADRHRAAGAVPVAAGGVVLRAPEVGQDRLPRPVVVAQADPAVEVAAVGAHRIAAVDGRGAADDLAARDGHDARGLDAEARLGRRGRDDARRLVAPVVVHPAERPGAADVLRHLLDGRIVRTGLQQEHRDVGILAQPSWRGRRRPSRRRR